MRSLARRLAKLEPAKKPLLPEEESATSKWLTELCAVNPCPPPTKEDEEDFRRLCASLDAFAAQLKNKNPRAGY